jgi:hypothetical protein
MKLPDCMDKFLQDYCTGVAEVADGFLQRIANLPAPDPRIEINPARVTKGVMNMDGPADTVSMTATIMIMPSTIDEMHVQRPITKRIPPMNSA